MTPTIAIFTLMLSAAHGPDLSQPFTVGQPVRLAITPVLDGKLAEEEWDALSTQEGFDTYLQWEPEKLYWAAKAAIGQDIVLSLDTNSDGWLIGDDNLEFRVSFQNDKPVLSARRLDATDPDGPRWVDASIIHESVKLAAAAAEGGWVLEASYVPPPADSPVAGRRYGLRMDTVETGSDIGAAYLPRNLSFVNLQFDLGKNLPSGFSWRPDFIVRNVPVDDAFKVKFGFKKTADVNFDQVNYRAEGYAKPLMAAGSKPFPAWDKKGRSGEQYATIIAQNAGVGYRILRLTLIGKDGQETVLRSSFKISDLIDFEVNLPKQLPLDPGARIIRGSVNLLSNGLRRIDGTFEFKVPDDWTATRGKKTPFTIYNSRGVSRVPLEFIVPKDTVGVFPVTFTATIGDKVVEKTVYIPVGQP